MTKSKLKRKLFTVVLPVAAGVFTLLFAAACCNVRKRMGELPDEAEIRRRAALSNYKDGRFVNQEPVTLDRKKVASSGGMWRFLFSSENAPNRELPTVPRNRTSFPAEPAEFSVTWLGHSSLIFELGGKRFLTDPVFGNAAPLPGIVRRYCAPPLPRRELPELDFILISHDHYDHLEYDTIRALRDSKVPFVTALGVGARLRGWGIAADRIHELNWHDSATVAGVKITALPARHFSGRSLKDRDRTLWASYIFEANGKKIFFGGDSGYGKHFREIGDAHGPFDLTCLEIDAWNERWPDNHMFPHQTIRAHRDLRGRELLPIHWGVFDLAMHPWDESIRQIAGLAAESEIPLLTPRMGEPVTPGQSETGRWWE